MADVLSGFDASIWQAGAYSGGGGFAFGLVKLTEGVGFKDPAADRHLRAILAQPIVPGGYHFARPDLNPGTSGAFAEADWHWAVASSYGGALGMLLGLDAESIGGSLQWCNDFTGRLAWRAGGYQALLYSYWAWLTSRGIPGSDLLTRSALWLAWPDANGPLPGTAISMQQYGLTSVPGLIGSVDANRFFGTIDQLKALTVGGDHVALDPDDPVIKDFYSAFHGLQDVLDNVYNWTRPDYQHQQDVTNALTGLAASQAALKASLDTVAGEVASGTPPNLTALAQAVATVDGHVAVLSKHLGVGVA